MTEYSFPPSSAVDSGTLEAYGPLIPVRITVPLRRKHYLEQRSLPPHAVRSGYALIDTGAHTSAVDDRVMEALEVPFVNQEETITPHGVNVSNVYNASVLLDVAGGPELELTEVYGCYLGALRIDEQDVIMLLGRDLLRRFTMTYDGPNGRVLVRG